MSDAIGLDLQHPFDEAPAPYEVPVMWTAEHVAHRLVEAFKVLLAASGRVGPRRYANGWPAMLQEFADLIDEDAMKNARDAFAKAWSRPTAIEIALSDEALAWPLKYAADEPMACDAVLLWSFCTAGEFSIAAALRARTAKAKRRAAVMQAEEDKRIALERKKAIWAAGQWRAEMAKKMNIASMPEPEKSSQWTVLTKDMKNRIAKDLARLKPVIVLPFHAVPEKILSRTNLDRYLPAGLDHLSKQLRKAKVPVR